MKLKLGLFLAAIASFAAVLPAEGAVVVDIHDRPYYVRGPSYYVGRVHYVWIPGHWNRRHQWIHGHYAPA